ncbi:hypothetical protein D3C86_962930 [compost metagenome]
MSPEPETLAVKLSLQFTLTSPEPETVILAFLDFKFAASISPEPESLITTLSELPFNLISPEPLKLKSKEFVATSKSISPDPDNFAENLSFLIGDLVVISPEPERLSSDILSNGIVISTFCPALGRKFIPFLT